ncbi:hypothetical protein VaNZ11_017004 [Volvox africanus]|uniref:RING-type domain-containing protein n=1 Tax=Volvox africanus TaxID=51714 RepID=A0ABQ5SQK4_9CHLO|nr:hypothetical protein VaNZ11_017004 [Volvox africanus]
MGHSTDALLRAFANFPDARCQTPLHLACIYGHHEVAERLLQLGGTPWSWDELGGRTPLHYAASMGHVDVIRVIVSHSAPAPTGDALRRPNSSRTRLVDICNDSGYTPLHYAVWAGNPTSVRALTSYEASLSARNVACGSDWVVSCLKCTPLHLAAHKGNQTIAKLLLSAYVQYQPPQGTDATPLNDRRRRDPRRHVNANRQLPYHVAVARNHTHLTEMLHPDVPFSFILNPAEMESRLYGVPKLAVLAAKTLQYKLVADIESAVAAMAAAPTRVTVPSLSSVGALGGAARMRSGSLVALSGAVMAAATSQAAGNAATAAAQQVLAAATARLRTVNERSLHGSTAALQAMDSAGLPALMPSTPSQQHQRPVAGADSIAPTDVQLQPLGPVVVAASPVTASIGVAMTATMSASATTVANGAAGKQPSSPLPGKSLATSAGASDGEALRFGGASDLAAWPTAVDEGGSAATPPAVLPLPPAPISPFLTAASSAAASSGVGGDTPQGGHRPTFNEAASAFALFAAEPFDEPAGGGGGAPGGAQAVQPAGSASASLAMLARNRAMQAASSSSPQTAGSNSVSIAVLARSKLAPGGGAGAGNKVAPSRSRSLRALLTGNKNRCLNASNAGGAVPSSMAGPQQQQTQPHARSELSSAEDFAAVAEYVLDDLDDILEAMRPPDDITTGEIAPPATAVPTISPNTTDAAGSVLDTAASAAPPSASQLSSLQVRARYASGGGSRPFWRRLSTQPIASPAASDSTQQLTLEAGPSCNGSLHAGYGGTVGTAPPETLLSRASMRSRAPSLPVPPPPGVIESRGSTEISGVDVAVATARRQLPLTPMESIDDDPDAAFQSDTGVRSLRRSSISLAALARGGAEAVLQTPAEPEQVDGAVLAMLASLVEAPQNVLRRYRLLQLTHGLDLQDLLRDHSEQAAAAAAGTVGALGSVQSSAVLDGQPLLRTASDVRAAPAVTTMLPSSSLHVSMAARCPAGDGKVEDSMHIGTAITACVIGATNCSVASVNGGRASVDPVCSASIRQAPPPGGSASPFSQEASNSTVISMGARPLTCMDSNVDGVAAAGAGCPPTNAASANLAGQLLRTLSSAAASESGEGTCGVCFDQPDVLSILRCGHRLCADCSRELCKLNALKPALCPFCRGMIGGFKYIGHS